MTPDKHDMSRRDFLARSIAIGLVAATSSPFAATLAVIESEVTVKKPDGTCDAAFIHPASGAYPGVIIWSDGLGCAQRCANGEAPRRGGLQRARAESVLSHQQGAAVRDRRERRLQKPYPAKHGWCVSDMPVEDGAPI